RRATARSCRPASCAISGARRTARFEKTRRRSAGSFAGMFSIAIAQMWVHDQDEALAFYTDKLGMEVRADVTMPEMGNFRWLTVCPPRQAHLAYILRVPRPPVMTPEAANDLLGLIAGGHISGFHLATDDC